MKLKPYAIAKYLSRILIRWYYYIIRLHHFSFLIFRIVAHPLTYKEEKRYNKLIRSAFLWVGGGLLRAREYKSSRPAIRVLLNYMEGLLKPGGRKSKPVVYIGWCVSTEFMRAFDAYFVIPEVLSVAASFAGQDFPTRMLEAAEAEGVPEESCSAAKLGAGAFFTQQIPPPDVIVTSSHPCDAGVGWYPTAQNLTGAPMYVLDTPYWENEASFSYYEKNIWGMIRFLEKHLNQKIDWDKLKDSCEELNKTNHYLSEMAEMGRAIPSPVSAQTLIQFWAFKLMGSGSPLLTKAAEMCYEDAKKRLDLNEGYIKSERIRIIWWDVPIAYINLFPWLEKEFGAIAVADYMGWVNSPAIDTSSEESMVRDMAKVHLSVAMARQSRGPYEYITREFEQIIEEYSGDCFIFTGNMGCKHGKAALKIKRDICRKAGLPALFMSTDYADRRIASEEAIKKQIADFFWSNGLA